MSGDGDVLATASAGYPTARPLPGRAEQDPADWFSAVVDVVAALTAVVPAGRWAGIGLSAMIPTLVLADADRRPDRTGDHVGGRSRRSGRRAVPRRGRRRCALPRDRPVGRRPLPAPDGALARTRSAGARIDRAAWVLGAKDHLFHRLTGEVATDPSTATGFGCYSLASGSWDGTLAEATASKLPPVEADVVLARLASRTSRRRSGCRRACPSCSAPRTPCAARSAPARSSAGDRVSLWGTSTAIIGVSAELVLDPAHRYLVTPLALR